MKKTITWQAQRLSNITFFFLFGFIYFFRFTSAQDHWGIKYKVQNDTAKKIIVVTFDATDAKSNVYFEDVVCKILYLDRHLAEIGSGEINFTNESPKTLWGQRKYVKTFSMNYPNAFIAKGTEISCIGNVSGGKADGEQPPAVALSKKNPSDAETFINTDVRSESKKTVILGRAKLAASSHQ